MLCPLLPYPFPFSFFFFFNDTATTEIYTLSLHDALPICLCRRGLWLPRSERRREDNNNKDDRRLAAAHLGRSEEHTSELQSHLNLVCRLLLEKKKKTLKLAVYTNHLALYTDVRL